MVKMKVRVIYDANNEHESESETGHKECKRLFCLGANVKDVKIKVNVKYESEIET